MRAVAPPLPTALHRTDNRCLPVLLAGTETVEPAQTPTKLRTARRDRGTTLTYSEIGGDVQTQHGHANTKKPTGGCKHPTVPRDNPIVEGQNAKDTDERGIGDSQLPTTWL